MNFADRISKLPRWMQVLLLSWSVRAAALGAVLPNILDVVAQHVDSLPALNDGYKSIIRTVALVAAIVLRATPQATVTSVLPADNVIVKKD